MERKLSITLRRSCIGRPPKQRLVALGLGLTKLNKRVLLQDTPEIRGMVYMIRHLVEAEEILVEAKETL